MSVSMSMRRAILLRLMAIGLGFSPFILAELILIGLGWGRADDHVDPFVGFSGKRPLFVLNDAGDRYEIPAGRQMYFRPESFAAVKHPDECRVFCLGGSTVQGRPYAIETSFTTWIELSLQVADDSRQWELINCGGVSYASYRLAPILEEVLNYEPDLIILYTGHNEFLEDRTYESIKLRSEPLKAALHLAAHWRTFNVIRGAYGSTVPKDETTDHRELLPEEVQARLDYKGGLEKYERDPDWHRRIAAHFRFNVERMISMCNHAEVPIWIADPVCNLRGSPPFKSASRSDIRPDEYEEWKRLRQEASNNYRTDMSKSVRLLREALAIDDQHAGLWFDLAKAYEALGQFDSARAAYMEAKERDICPLRITEPLRQGLLEAAEQSGTPVVPLFDLFAEQSEHGIPGGFLMVDHVHPSISGHQLIADLVVDRMIGSGWVEPRPNWQPEKNDRFRRHIESLDDVYYIEGERRLKGLLGWARGRATRVPDAGDQKSPPEDEETP